MKRSRVLLGMGIGLVALAGAFTTKAATQTFTYYYVNASGVCTSENVPNQCTTTGSGCVDLSNRQLYQTIDPITGQCQTPLKQ